MCTIYIKGSLKIVFAAKDPGYNNIADGSWVFGCWVETGDRIIGTEPFWQDPGFSV
jgi:hypothetical protein